jgi:orotidine-5'-phosphate decarboxylase
MRPEDRIIIALDVSCMEEARKAARELKGAVRHFKVGGELFTSCGRDPVKMLRDSGLEVFLDLKLHDIPNTVERVSLAICAMNVKMFTLHASGGSAMIKAAVRAASASENKPLVLAVTVLTHIDGRTLKDELGIGRELEKHVLKLAVTAVDSGADGVICSPREISVLRKTFRDNITIVTPGIRPAGTDINDQSRTFTPGRALDEGADYIVIGRPVMNAPDRKKAAENIIKAIKAR